ncbi:MAG: nucleotide pyrophosphohydrolase [Planctomycetota bacterium]
MEKPPKTFQEASQRVASFLEERPSWKPFHSPKNLAISLMLEAGELLEHFQWCTTEQSLHPDPAKQEQIQEEVGDILYLIFDFCNTLQMDPATAFAQKLKKTGEKYPPSISYRLTGFKTLLQEEENNS